MELEATIAEVTFHIGESEWQCTYDGKEMTAECGGLELKLSYENVGDSWIHVARKLVLALEGLKL